MDIISIVISIAAFVTAVLGPLGTALIQSKHENKMYQNRFYTEHKQEVIENYIKAVGRYVFSDTWDDKRNFGEASAEIFMYTPPELWDDIKEINLQLSIMSTVCEDSNQFKQRQRKIQEAYFSLCEKFHRLNRNYKSTRINKKN